MTENSYLIVGLGNPGKSYTNTRHNIGFKVVEALAEKKGLVFRKDRTLKGEMAKGGTLYLLKPQTFMNESGDAVMQTLHYYHIPIGHMLVVTDDFAIPFGELRLRSKGSSGGHNGLKDIEMRIQSQDYARLRIGIGEPGLQSWPDYVLEEFTPEEERSLPEVITSAVDAIDLWVERGIDTAMKSVNTKKDKK